MTGYLDYARQNSETPKHTRILFHLANEYWLAYVSQRKLGLMTLADDAEDFVQQQEMGPDALDDRLTFAQFRQRLEGRRGRIKPALMNQSILAGVGSVYADETLLQSGIAPDRSVADLDEAELRQVHRALQLDGTAADDHRRSDGADGNPRRVLNGSAVNGGGFLVVAEGRLFAKVAPFKD